MSQKQVKRAKKGFLGVFLFYFFVAFEFAYMAGPFAIYFYSLYSPVLNFLNKIPVLSGLVRFFLPHVVRETASPVIGVLQIVDIVCSVAGFVLFIIGACQVYYSKLRKKGAVLGGLYRYVRHPQYTSFIVCSFGMLLLWPRYIVIIFFVTLVFAYYFLARAEEVECEEKFGQSYIEYEVKTGRFFPNLLRKEQKVRKARTKGQKAGMTAAAYVVTLTVMFAGASLLNQVTVNSLYASYDEKSATVALCQLETSNINQIVEIAKKEEEVQRYLDRYANSQFQLNYILPTEWFAAEIPMNGIEYRKGHSSPANYDHSQYKLILTSPELRENTISTGKEILKDTKSLTPIVEVWVDLNKGQVTKIKDMPKDIKYEGIPEAIY
ncbi:MAG: isoprenylcysteine carboxylmethyltransferase family protein [bacterium]|nr:isoprenylcysteine carboxylmethyltransferase family protein [bacterium]